MTNAVVLAQGAGVNLTNRNRIINGDMRIDQRNAGAGVATSSGTNFYTVDRWRMFQSQVSKYTIQQNQGSVTTPTGFSNYLGITSSSAYTVGSGEVFLLQHFVEGFNIADLGWGTANAQPITISFWVQSSLTGTFGGSLLNNGNVRSYPFSYTISAANTWEKKTVTIAGDTSGTWLINNSVGVNLNFSIGTGSSLSGSAGSWSSNSYFSATGATSVVGTNGATFYITGVQLEAGSVATPFERRPYGTELALCQRYYQKHTGNGAYPRVITAAYTNGVYIGGSWSFYTNMRVTPTALQFGSWGYQSCTSPPEIQVSGTNGFMMYVTSTAGAQICGFFPNEATSGGSFSAEL
jgi:hypothetical protein